MSPLCLRSPHLPDGHKSTYFNSLVVRINFSEMILRKKKKKTVPNSPSHLICSTYYHDGTIVLSS